MIRVCGAILLLVVLLPVLLCIFGREECPPSAAAVIPLGRGIVSDISERVAEPTEVHTEKTESLMLLRTGTGEVMTLSCDEYLVGVLAAEVYSSYDPDALSAQAVAARSYFEYNRTQKKSAHRGCDICDDPAHCQAFMTLDEAKARWGEAYAEGAWKKLSCAVSEVSGVILTYEGEAANALYHASSVGMTEAAESLWEGSPSYLMSVASPEDAYIKTVEVSYAKMKSILASEGISPRGEPAGWFCDIAYTEGGRVDFVLISGVCLSGTRLRAMLGLASCDIEVEYSEGAFTFTTYGYGHGVGMSQAGAACMAASGSGWREILMHYYPGCELSFI